MYSNLNRLIAQMTASLTTSFSLQGTLKMDLSIFHQNLVPYPRIRFMLPSYSPFLSSEDAYRPELTV
jgi:tubulin alpha